MACVCFLPDFTLQMGTCRCDLHVNVPLPGCIMPTTLLEFIICLYIVMFHANDSSLELASRIQHAHYKNIVGNKYLTNTDLVQKYYHHTKGPKIGGDAPLPQLPHGQVPCDEALLKTKRYGSYMVMVHFCCRKDHGYHNQTWDFSNSRAALNRHTITWWHYQSLWPASRRQNITNLTVSGTLSFGVGQS